MVNYNMDEDKIITLDILKKIYSSIGRLELKLEDLLNILEESISIDGQTIGNKEICTAKKEVIDIKKQLDDNIKNIMNNN